jgi:peptidoglycan/LPS O-acetylase OafA/YrhL
MSTLISQAKYRPEIDGLRAIAVVSVLLFHAFPKRFPAGFIGVDIFFVISGFLITSILLNQVGKGTFSYLDFYARRIKRIFPALLLVLGTTFAASWYVLMPDEFAQVSRHIAAGAAFLANFALWSESGYFDAAADTKPLLHLWSLAVEEQFYIVWPVLISLVFAKSRKYFFGLAVALWVLSFMVSLYLTYNSPTAAFYSPWGRFWELGTGGLLAYLQLNSPVGSKDKLWSNVQGWLGAALLISSFFFISKADPFPGWLALLPVFGAALLIAAGPQAAFCRYVLSNRVFVFIGLVSYPLYLWHWPLLIIPKIALGDNLTSITKAGLLGLSFILATLTYYVVEGRLRHAKSLKVPQALAGAMLAFLVLGLSVSLMGFTSRHKNPDMTRLLNAKLDWEYPARGFKALGGVGHQFWYQNSDVAQKTVFIGDSNMEQYAPRISKLLSENPAKANSVVFATRGSCPVIPALFAAMQGCKEDMPRALTLAMAKDVSTVVIGQLWIDYPNLATDVTLQESLAAQIKALSTTKKVFVILNIPAGADFNPKNMFTGSRLTSLKAKDPNQIQFDLKKFKTEYDPLFNVIRTVAVNNGAEVIDPMPEFCTATACAIFDKNKEPLYIDNAHVRASYVETEVRILDRTVLKN